MTAHDPKDGSRNEEEIIRLADAEREAGVPDVQTAAAAVQAKERLSRTGSEDEAEGHPS